MMKIAWEQMNLGSYGCGHKADFSIEGIDPEITPQGIDLEEVRKILEINSSRTRRYEVILGDDEFRIIALPTVYLCRDFGRSFGDTEYYLKEIPLIVGSGRLFEIGCGTGIISIACAIHNKYGNNQKPYVAIDINPKAVECAKENVKINGLEGIIDVRQGDVFDGLGVSEKFDLIFWNHPFHKGNEDETFTQMHGFDPLFRGIEKYACEGHRYLMPGGRLLLGTGNYAELDYVREIMQRNELGFRLISWREFPFNASKGHLNTYNIYEIEKR
jgi:SAM-dependent methyltransferase